MCVSNFTNFSQMLSALPDDNACRIYLERLKWNGEQSCPYCHSEKYYQLRVKGEFKGMYKCGGCKKRYNVCIGTIFEGSHIGLRKWFIAMYIFSTNKKGISSHQLSADLGITQKSAWFMLQRIRHIYSQDAPLESDSISCFDETFVGGKNKNRHADKKVPMSQGRSYKDKTPVFGMVRDNQVYTKVIPDTKATTLKPLVKELVKEGATIVTDEWKGYNGLNSLFDQKIVNHSAKQYECEGYSTNNVENFWSHFKRGIYGMYHQVSRKHLQRYADEFSFRYNVKQEKPIDRFKGSLLRTDKGRLRYKDLINWKPKPKLPPMAFPELGF